MHFGKHDRFLDSSWGENAPDTQTCTSLINIAMGAEVSVVDPKNIHEALDSENRDRWVEAIAEEMRQHEINGTFGPPQVLPLGFKATNTRFLFKTKMGANEHGEATSRVDRYKARLLYQNNPWTGDFSPWEETFAPVVDKNTSTVFSYGCD